MIIRDFNGTGPWAVSEVHARYCDYVARYGVHEPLKPEPKVVTRGDTCWVYPVMDPIIDGVKRGDVACIALAVEFIECDAKFPFGANLKARAARALRSAVVPQSLAKRIRRRVADMLAANNTPREFREYVRLLRRIGFDEVWPRIVAASPGYNRYTMRHFTHLRQVHERNPAVFRVEF